MRINVLISCMNEQDCSIIERSNVQTDVVVVNQCDKDDEKEFEFINRNGVLCRAKFINTKERGLSRSRNMAIQKSWGDVCYLCDDDEVLADDFETKIVNAYSKHQEEDIIIFAINRKHYVYPNKEQKLSLPLILKSSSVQTTFKRSSIIGKEIFFDVLMGSGSGHGGGEENKFLMDCKRKGLRLFYVPSIIATVISEDSQWFHGFNEKYFKDTGWAVRRILGTTLGIIYLVYWSIFRSGEFEISYSKLSILKLFLKGFFEQRA